MATELSKMGADIKERPDGLEIVGRELHGANVNGYNDHRIVMALTIAGMAVGKTRINTAESVDVSYPGFFQQMESMSAKIKLQP
jgi:3-phosphoshikimate 1-carboxyvinyltransferase